MGYNEDTFQLIHISKNFSFSFSLTFVWQNMSFSLTWMNKIILAKESLTSVIYIKTFRYFFSMAGQKKNNKKPRNSHYSNYFYSISYYLDIFDTKIILKLLKNIIVLCVSLFWTLTFSEILTEAKESVENVWRST